MSTVDQTEDQQLREVKRRLMAKVRAAISYADNGDPIKDVIDDHEIIEALRLLVVTPNEEPLTSNLVVRLRKLREEHPYSLCAKTGEEAADEIERLMREREAAVHALSQQWCDKHEIVAGCPGCIEVEYRRLRAALEKIGAMACPMGYDSGHAGIDAIVRETLAGASDEPPATPDDRYKYPHFNPWYEPSPVRCQGCKDGLPLVEFSPAYKGDDRYHRLGGDYLLCTADKTSEGT